MKNLLVSILACSAAFGLAAHSYAAETAISKNVTFTLTALEETCAPYMQDAHKSLEDAELAKYCITTGESIAISATQTAHEKAYVKSVLNNWVDGIQPILAAK